MNNDLISRSAMLDIVDRMEKKYGQRRVMRWDGLRHLINKMPAAQITGECLYGDPLPVCNGDCGAPTPEEARKRLLPKEDKPKVIYLGYSSHDCESRYKCPVCGALFGSWDIHEEKNENGTKKCCPDCKTELSWSE